MARKFEKMAVASGSEFPNNLLIIKKISCLARQLHLLINEKGNNFKEDLK
jgi:hypothetical protein